MCIRDRLGTGQLPDVDLPTNSFVTAKLDGDLVTATINSWVDDACWQIVVSVAGDWVRTGDDKVAVTNPQLRGEDDCLAA